MQNRRRTIVTPMVRPLEVMVATPKARLEEQFREVCGFGLVSSGILSRVLPGP